MEGGMEGWRDGGMEGSPVSHKLLPRGSLSIKAKIKDLV